MGAFTGNTSQGNAQQQGGQDAQALGGFADYAFSLARMAIQEHEASQTDEWNQAQLREVARTADVAAVDILSQGGAAAGRARQRASMMQSQQALAAAAAGVDSTTGSAALAGESVSMMAELDVATARTNARNAALGYRQAATRARGDIAAIKRQSDARQLGYVAELGAKQLSMLTSPSMIGGH